MTHRDHNSPSPTGPTPSDPLPSDPLDPTSPSRSNPWKRAAPWLGWELIFLVLGLAVSRHPLFGVVSYESAFLTAILVGLAGLHLAPTTMARWRRKYPGWAPKTLRQSAGLLAGLLWSATWPLLVMLFSTANVIWVLGHWRCNQLLGLWFFLLLPGVTALVAAALGLATAFFFQKVRTAVVAGYLLLLAIWASGLWRFYSNPPVAVYDPVVGYFSGNLYDSLLLLEPALVWARLFHLLATFSFLALAAWIGPNSPVRPLLSIAARRTMAGVAMGLIIFSTVAASFRTNLGFDLDAQAIQSRLGGLARSPHFLLVYDRTATSRADARRLLFDAEFRYHQLKEFFGTSPKGRITIYLFATSLQKKRLFGAHEVEMAKPWRKEIYITDLGLPHPVIKHELAHVFAGTFGDPVFAVSFRWARWLGIIPIPNFNPGLIEGAAVAADWPPADLDPDEKTKALFELGWQVPLADVMGYSFFANAAVRSYSVAGSFCRFLVHRYGATKFRRLYHSGGDFQGVYGRCITELERAWKKHIAQVPLAPNKLALARRRLQRRSVFASPCLHKIASLDLKAAGLPPHQARTIHERICHLDPSDPSHLWDLLADQIALSHVDQAMGTGLSILRHPQTTRPSKARLFLVLGDFLWKKGNPTLARAFYERAQVFASKPAQDRAITVRLASLADPLVRPLVRRLLVDRDRSAIQQFPLALRRRPSWAIGYYLLGSWMLFDDKPAQAAFALRQALKGPLPGAPLRWEAALRLGRARFALGRYGAAQDIFQRLSRSPAPAWIQRLAADWAQRCRWMDRQGSHLTVTILK